MSFVVVLTVQKITEVGLSRRLHASIFRLRGGGV